MKFKLLYESSDSKIPYEELEEDLKEEQQQEDSSVAYVIDMLEKEDFKQKRELNGVSLKRTINDDGVTYNCQFYVDTEADTYSSYVTSETDGIKATSFQQKGPLEDAESAVDKFIRFLGTL